MRGPVRELLSAQPFLLEEPYTHSWRREQPRVFAGWLLVLAVDPAYVEPRQAAEPVLYVGSETAARVNHGFASGRVVAIVPSARDGDALALDLAEAPIWFGEPDLPERVDAAQIAREREQALRRGVRPFGPGEIAAARTRAPDTLRLVRREDLDALAGALVLEHSPEEHELGSGLLVPPSK